MLNDIDAIKRIKKFIDDNVVPIFDPDNGMIGLEKPRHDNKVDISYELVKPAVFESWVLPKEFLDESFYSIPGIVVMSDGGSDKEGEASTKIRIIFATYDCGITTLADGKYSTSKDAKGYYDLMNLITQTRMKLSDPSLTAKKLSINYDFEWSMYEEQKWPYWHGQLSFTCPIVSSQNLMNL
jgi:hypothetical protein